MNIQGSQEQLTQQVNDDKDTARTRRNQLEWRKYFDWGVAPTQRMGKIDRMQSQRIKHGEIGHRDILKIAAALLALGRNDFADVDLYRNDPLFKEALNLQKIPSAETLRQRLNDLGLCNAEQTLMDDCLVEFLRKVNDFGKIQTQYAEYIPLDIDVSVMLQPNCKKRV